MDRELNIDGMKLFKFKKLTCPAVSSGSTDSERSSGHPCNYAVRERLPTSTKLKISHSAKKINHGNSTVYNGKLRDG